VTDPDSRPKQTEGVPTSAVIPKDPVPRPVEFREIFEQQLDYVLRTLRFLGIGAADLEDVAHDVFLHVYRHLGNYDPSRPLRPWLYAFICRTARDFRVLCRHRETVCDDLSYHADGAPNQDRLLIRRQMQGLALRGLEALDDDERMVLVATTLDELSAPEIAEALSIPLNTVYSRLRRARSKFAAAVSRQRGKARHS
jgi:RNA polymerase sigma-70 factor, ECF subfamily